MMRVIRSDEGFAMAAVMGAIALITVLAFGGYFLAQTALHDSQRVTAETRAFQVAESGLDREVSSFNPAKVGTAKYPVQGSTDDGTYVVDVRQVGTGGLGGEYLMTSVGTSQEASESVSLRFFYLDLWKMNISAGDSNAFSGAGNTNGWNGTATIRGPLYIRGDFDWSQGNADYDGGPLLVRDGDIIVGGSAAIGDTDPPYIYVTGNITGNTTNVTYSRLSHSVPDITLPWVDDEYLDTMYQRALEESVDNNMGSLSRSIPTTEAIGGDPTTYETALAPATRTSALSLADGSPTSDYYKFIGDASGPSALGAGTHNVVIDSVSFGAWEGNGYAYDASDAIDHHDDFAYDAATGTLYVEGTVFIDGGLTISNNVRQYKGRGTLVVNGPIDINCESLWPAPGWSGAGTVSINNSLGLVTPEDIIIGENYIDGRYNGAIFSNGQVQLNGTHSYFKGSILSNSIYGDNPGITLEIDPLLFDVLPESMPASGGGIVYNGQWTRH